MQIKIVCQIRYDLTYIWNNVSCLRQYFLFSISHKHTHTYTHKDGNCYTIQELLRLQVHHKPCLFKYVLISIVVSFHLTGLSNFYFVHLVPLPVLLYFAVFFLLYYVLSVLVCNWLFCFCQSLKWLNWIE